MSVLDLLCFRFQMAGVVSVGVHIFKHELAAVENYFIYKLLDNDLFNYKRTLKLSLS